MRTRIRFAAYLAAGALTLSAPSLLAENGNQTQTTLLSVEVTGLGRVVSDPPGISCPGDCQAEFPAGTSVRLKAHPGKGQDLLTFTGACHPATKSCNVYLDRATRLIQVSFTRHF
jgi:hypothetical protein